MNFLLKPEQKQLIESLKKSLETFDDAYWMACDNEAIFPSDFYKQMVKGGWLGITFPSKYGGSGLGISEAALMMMEIAKKGGMTAASSIHMNIFSPSSIIKFGTDTQCKNWLPDIINGKSKVCFAVTEPNIGLNTRNIKTFALKEKTNFTINGKKIWTSTAQIADKLMILARTSEKSQYKNSNEGLSLFYTNYDRSCIETKIIKKMGRESIDSNMLFIDNLKVSQEDLIGNEGEGFKYILHSLNPERILVAAEAIGIAESALNRAANYANERIVFDRPIGMNQSIQHPLAECWAKIESAKLLIFKAAYLYDNNKPCGLEANAAKYLSAEIALSTCQQAMATLGGMGYAKEFHVERLFRESMIPYLAPVSQQLALCYLAERALGLPKSY